MSLNSAMLLQAKQDARLKIARWMRAEIKAPNLLTLPGSGWAFERILKPNNCIGLEKSTGRAAAASRSRPNNRYRLIRTEAKSYLLEAQLDPQVWNCVFLDTCSPISKELIDTLKALSAACSVRKDKIAVAVTIVNHREQTQYARQISQISACNSIPTSAARALLSFEALSTFRQFSPREEMIYHTTNSMMVVTGHFPKRN